MVSFMLAIWLAELYAKVMASFPVESAILANLCPESKEYIVPIGENRVMLPFEYLVRLKCSP